MAANAQEHTTTTNTPEQPAPQQSTTDSKATQPPATRTTDKPRARKKKNAQSGGQAQTNLGADSAQQQQEQSNSGGTNTQQQSAGPDSPNISCPGGVCAGHDINGNPIINNYGPIEWRVDKDKGDAVVSLLSNAPQKANLLISAEDSSYQYADDFRRIAAVSGWHAGNQVWPFVEMPALTKGVHICLPLITGRTPTLEDAFPDFDKSDPMTYLDAAFDYLHIPRKFCRESAEAGLIIIKFFKQP